jgi:hypothetical protein
MAITGRSHCYKNSTIVIMNWLTATKKSITETSMDIFPSTYIFLSSFTDNTFTGIDYTWHKKQKRFTLRESMGWHPSFWWVPCCSSFVLFCRVLFFFAFNCACLRFVSCALCCPCLWIVHSVVIYITVAGNSYTQTLQNPRLNSYATERKAVLAPPVLPVVLPLVYNNCICS